VTYKGAFWILLAALLVGFWWGLLSVRRDRNRRRGTLSVLQGGRSAAPGGQDSTADIESRPVPQGEDLPTAI
jgi:hypothetical protein